jgi:hypothetical protein
MQIFDLESWEAVETKIRELCERYDGTRLLFRGQGDASWTLATTLERVGVEGMRFTAYYELISRLHPEIESFTGNNWDIPDFPKMNSLLREYGDLKASFPTSAYAYMLYLRHHGFPSPLLDWTRSPYVAAYFAFRHRDSGSSGKVSLYVYSEMPRNFKVLSNNPRIIRFGPFVRTHRRHFLQQSEYSICVHFENMWRFARHGDVFDLHELDQDVLFKIDIPVTERSKVLTLLDDHNLNAFSLFGTDEGLMEAMTFRALERARLLN